jgi:hypothetical protein
LHESFKKRRRKNYEEKEEMVHYILLQFICMKVSGREEGKTMEKS